jgi:hypothetical protein
MLVTYAVMIVVLGLAVGLAALAPFYGSLRAPRCPVCSGGSMRWVASRAIAGATSRPIDLVDRSVCARCGGSITQSHRYGWQVDPPGSGSDAGRGAARDGATSWRASRRLWRALDRLREPVPRWSGPPRDRHLARGLALVASGAAVAGAVVLLAAARPAPAGGAGASAPWSSALDAGVQAETAPGEVRTIERLGIQLRMRSEWRSVGTRDTSVGAYALFSLEDPSAGPVHLAIAVEPGLRALSDPRGSCVRTQEALRTTLDGSTSRPGRERCEVAARGCRCTSVADDGSSQVASAWAWTASDHAVTAVAAYGQGRALDRTVAELEAILWSIQLVD